MEGEEKEKSDGRVKAGGVQRGEQDRGGRVERGRGGNHITLARGRMKHVFLSPATHCKWMAPAILPSATYLCSPKVEKKGRAKRREGREDIVKECLLPQTHCNLLQFLKTNMTGWNYSATTESFANAIKCRYKSPSQMHLIWSFCALQQQPSSQACVYSERPLQFSFIKSIVSWYIVVTAAFWYCQEQAESFGYGSKMILTGKTQ